MDMEIVSQRLAQILEELSASKWGRIKSLSYQNDNHKKEGDC